MTNAFDREVIAYADGMGISLYQRFSVHEASLFLRIQQTELEKLIKQHHISFIQVTKTEVQFFGFQLIDYLINHIKTKEQPKQTKKTSQDNIIPNNNSTGDRIIRFPELKKLVGLSRTTIWRLERDNKFPKRVAITNTLIGWHLSEVERWKDERN